VERKTRSDKKHRVAPSLDADTHDKLKLLALACDQLPKTKLTEHILVEVLNNPNWVKHLQLKFGPINNPYKILPIIANGKTIYKTDFEAK
jgi:hypothetical protein